MIKMLLIWIAALTLIAELSSEQATLDRPRVFCGRALAEARMLFCLGTDDKFAELQQKRSTDSPEEYTQWWSSRRMAFMLGKRGGLVDDCCLKPCYLSELLSHC